MELNAGILDSALHKLGDRLQQKGCPPIRLVVCGGSALLAMGLSVRTTEDVDVVALVDEDDGLASPVPFPACFEAAIHEVSLLTGLPEDWLNNGPSRDPGGLFQSGLPEGILDRAGRRSYGVSLEVFFTGRLDQIFFKVFASADSMGVHVSDLMELDPTPDEMENAARWCVSIDPSTEFRNTVISMLSELGYGKVAESLQA